MIPLADYPLNDETVSPGYLGFGVFLIIAFATFLLVRNMNQRIRRLDTPTEAQLKQEEWERASARASEADGRGADGPADSAPRD